MDKLEILAGERYCRQFEEPLPVLATDQTLIRHRSSPDIIDGKLRIINKGGGLLRGFLFTSNKAALSSNAQGFTQVLRFHNNRFEGNESVVEYEIDCTYLNAGDVFNETIYIESNGGACLIPVTVNIEAAFLEAGDIKIHSLEQFAAFAMENPKKAAAVFKTLDFSNWLSKLSSTHMDYFYRLQEDSDVLRGMDNFLRACGLKSQSKLRLESTGQTFKLYPKDEDTLITGHIPLSINEWGAFKYDVSLRRGQPFIQLSKQQVSMDDFDTDGKYDLGFKIDPQAVLENYMSDTVILSAHGDMFYYHIQVSKPPVITVKASKSRYSLDDTGFIAIYNHTGYDVMAEIFVQDNVVRFASAKYLMSAYAKIPFDIKIGILSQVAGGKKPFYETKVGIRVNLKEQTFKKILTITCGEPIPL